VKKGKGKVFRPVGKEAYREYDPNHPLDYKSLPAPEQDRQKPTKTKCFT
jgi:hypothetical protein